VRNGSLRSNVVFEKEVISHEFDFKTSEFDFEVPKSFENTQLRVTMLFFLPLLSRNFDDQLSSNFTGLLFYAYGEIHKL
jgi:hypothetical protein